MWIDFPEKCCTNNLVPRAFSLAKLSLEPAYKLDVKI